MKLKQGCKLTISVVLTIALSSLIVINEMSARDNIDENNIQQENTSVESIEVDGNSAEVDMAIKELRKELKELKKAYKEKSIDKQEYLGKKKNISDELKSLGYDSYQKDEELTDDMLFEDADPTNPTIDPITTDEEIERMEDE